ncbi:peptidoglycan DD-metalloendopeptidase family protein [Phenylobacterium sp.]|uniref:peptidoglycan DD-metalloendopeptidase family protein n=1 Tax=Phenylobacterium sp. TaxID=1871053 RepID=UPI0035AFB9A3
MTLFTGRTALVLLFAGASLAACTTYDPLGGQLPEARKPAYPVRLEANADAPPAQAAAAPASAREPAAEPPPGAQPDRPPSEAGVPEPNYSPPPNISSSPLPPPAARGDTRLAQAETAPPPAARQPAAPAAPPAMRTITRASVAGKVVDAEGPPKVYTVEKGDTLYAISRKIGQPVDDIAKANGLKSPYRLHPGQTLKGPRSKAKAYVVGEGDTLYAIARRFGVSAGAVAEANGMGVGDTIHPGARLVLPEGFKDSGPVTTTVRVPVEAPPAPPPPPARTETRSEPPPAPNYPKAETPAPAKPAEAAPPPKPEPAPAKPAPGKVEAPKPEALAPTPVPTPTPTPPPAPKPAPAKPATPVIVPSTPSPADQQISQLGRGRFIWPLRGDILSTYGPKGTGQANDGINVRAPLNTAVRAAAEGEVVYAGDQVPGFGNLVLIKHADGWVTAYAHLSRVDVKMQQQVAQGQQIGMSGASGGVAEPQLHFEVRYAPTPADRAKPIDPMLVLPR